MSIRTMELSNFKSFESLRVELGKFNVVIGANASGKSNFIGAFRFLRDIQRDGLDDAISINGGSKALVNLRVGPAEDMEIKFVSDRSTGWVFGEKGVKTRELFCNFAIRFKNGQLAYEVDSDEMSLSFDVVRLEHEENLFKETDTLHHGKIVLTNTRGKRGYSLEPEDIASELADYMPFPPPSDIFQKVLDKRIEKNQLFLESALPFIMPLYEAEDIAIYNFDPNLARNPAQVVGKPELKEDGSNLSLVLRKIIDEEESRRKLLHLMKDLLPFVQDVEVQRLAENSLLVYLSEEYFDKEPLPAHMLSAGTINVTAMIAALYFQKAGVVIIEEPERNIHPYLMSRVIDMMKDASKSKQIIITTHSAEVVKYAGLDNILLVQRDKRGNSSISKPSEKNEVKVFLENEMGLDELYVENLLEL